MSGTPGTSVWGSSSDDLGDAEDVLTQGLDLEENGPATEAPAEEIAPAADEPETALDSTAEPVVEGEGEVEAEPAETLFAGKYRTPEDLEQGYRELSRMQREQAERTRQAEARAAQMEQAIRQWAAQQQAPAPAPAPAANEPSDAQLAAWGIDRATYAQLTPIIQSQVQAVVEPITQQMTAAQQQQYAQMEAARAAAEAEAARTSAMNTLEGFYTKHPEFVPGTDGHEHVASLVAQWNETWTGDASGATPGAFNPGDPEALEILAEAAKRPALAQVLRFNPTLIDHDEGMELARQQATILEATSRTQGVAQSSTPVSLPAVESGESGGGPRQLDAAPRTPIDEMLELDRADRQRSAFHQR